MKEEGDIFKKFRESFGKIGGHFHILEQRVPIELQMEYFRYSEKIRIEKLKQGSEEMDYTVLEDSLFDPESTTDHKRYVLSILAISCQVKAFRILENYVQHSDEEVSDWAYMALMESRISLESDLLDKKQIYISTGLGGKGEKMRFYVLILSKNKRPFLGYQREVIERELTYLLIGKGCEMERLTLGEQYVELVFLIPVRADIKLTLDWVINECNLYGDFLSDKFTITNVKELSQREIADIIKKNGNNKASR